LRFEFGLLVAFQPEHRERQIGMVAGSGWIESFLGHRSIEPGLPPKRKALDIAEDPETNLVRSTDRQRAPTTKVSEADLYWLACLPDIYNQ
jgi:hypothetical protein